MEKIDLHCDGRILKPVSAEALRRRLIKEFSLHKVLTDVDIRHILDSKGPLILKKMSDHTAIIWICEPTDRRDDYLPIIGEWCPLRGEFRLTLDGHDVLISPKGDWQSFRAEHGLDDCHYTSRLVYDDSWQTSEISRFK